MANQHSLLVLDLASYGAALAIINQFCDGKSVVVLEVSPVGTAGLLILEIKDQIASNLLKNEIYSFFKGSILSSRMIEKSDLKLLKVYLSQNQDQVESNLLIQEFSFVSDAFFAANHLLAEGITLVDFRVIRTFPMNVILTSTSSNFEKLSLNKNIGSPRVVTLVDKVESTLKEYFQVVQN